jgi:PAS domain S-box-containing protein
LFEGTNKKILLVEDEAIIALNERRILEKNGLDVSVAHNGDAAIDAIRTDETISLVLMDIDLGGGIDGTQAAMQILGIRDVPIVFLTSHSEYDMVKRVKGISRYGYVIKSSGEFVLIEAIQTAFELFDAYRQLQKSEHRYRTMVETAPMPFQSLDANGRILDVNNAWLSTLRYDSREEVLGMWFGDLLHPDQVELFRQRFPIFKAQGHIERVGFLMRRSDGSYVSTLFNGCIAYSEDGEFSHTVCVFQETQLENRSTA